MVKPDKMPQFLRAMVSEAHKQGWTAYRFKRDGVVPLSAAQKFLAGDLNPTASTCDAIAKALGVEILISKEGG